MKRAMTVLALAVLLIAPTTASAAILTFEFLGVAGAGSFINLGAGNVDVSGVVFTASGTTLNDIDLFAGGAVGDGVGFFATTATYDFGAFGAFTTNVGADFYGQNCETAVAVDCALLSDVGAAQGFRIDYAPAVAGDADFGIDIGTQIATGFQINTRTQVNAAGHTLHLATGGSIRSVTTSVPEPMSLSLLGLGLAGVAFARRKRAS